MAQSRSTERAPRCANVYTLERGKFGHDGIDFYRLRLKSAAAASIKDSSATTQMSWLSRYFARKPRRLASVALANKMVPRYGVSHRGRTDGSIRLRVNTPDILLAPEGASADNIGSPFPHLSGYVWLTDTICCFKLPRSWCRQVAVSLLRRTAEDRSFHGAIPLQ